MRFVRLSAQSVKVGPTLKGCCVFVAALLIIGPGSTGTAAGAVGPDVGRSELDGPGEPFRIGGEAAGAVRVCPAVAFDGENYMVVWEDDRNGSVDIYAARVSPMGSVLDPEGILVSGGPSHKEKPAIAFDGIYYMVVWGDDRKGSWDIYGARVSPSGSVLDPRGIAISTGGGTQSYPSIAFSGSRYLVVWHDERSDFVDIYGARLSTSGSVLDKNGLVIASGIAPEKPPGPGGIAGTDGPWGPRVTADGVGWFAVWQSGWGESWDVRAARVASDGSLLDPSPIAVSTSEDPDWYPDVTYDGTNYLVVWHAVSGGSFDVFGARVSPSGEVLDPDRIPISEHRFWQRFPTAASDGSKYIVAWANWTSLSQDVYIARVTSSGEVVDPQGAPVIRAEINIQWRPAIAFDGANYLMVCHDERGASGGNIYGVLVNREGVVVSKDIAISSEGDGPWGPDVAFGGESHVVVWGDREDGSGNIYGARVSADGALLDEEPIPISTAQGNQWRPAIAFDGVDYMIVWKDGRNGSWDIFGARVRPSGFVYNPEGVPITLSDGDETDPVIAFDGTNYMVAWGDQRDGQWDIYGVRMAPSGKTIDPVPFAISTANGVQRHPALAFDGTDYLVAWEDDRDGSWDIYGARVASDGTVLDPAGLPISKTDDDEWTPAVSFDGANFLVAWQVWSGGSGDIIGARVSPSGTVLDPQGIAISAAGQRQWAPAVVFNGTYHIVSWSDARSGKRDIDVFAARVSPLGGVLDPEGVPVSGDRDVQYLPALASDDSGNLLVAHSWLIPSSIFGYWRVWGVTWAPTEEPPLQVTLAVHQNPELTSELDIYLLPTRAVQDTSVNIAVQGVPLTVSATDRQAGIYRAGYRLSASGQLTINARVRDLGGYLTETSRQLGAEFIEAGRGGDVAGPRGAVDLHLPAGAVDRDGYVLILPEVTSDLSQDAAASTFLLSPPSLKLRRTATLTVMLHDEGREAVNSAGGDEQGLWPSLFWEGPSGWEPVESAYDARAGKLRASLADLGRFKVVWALRDVRRGPAEVLLYNVPNPFRSVVNVRYHMPAVGVIRVSVYDAGGRLVRTLFEGRREPGWHSDSWDGTDSRGAPLPSGMYFTDLAVGDKHISKKCILVR